MERTDAICSGVNELLSSTNLSLPPGAVTYPGDFEQSAEAYEVAKKLGIPVGVAMGRYTFMYSSEACDIVREYICKKRAESYQDDY